MIKKLLGIYFIYSKYWMILFLNKVFKNNYSLKRKEILTFFAKFNLSQKIDIYSIYASPILAIEYFLKIKKKFFYYKDNLPFKKTFLYDKLKKKTSRTILLGTNKKLNFSQNFTFFQSKSLISEYKNVDINNWYGLPIVLHGNKVIKNISSEYAGLSVEKKIVTKKTKIFDEIFLLFSDVDIQNYCHFILDVFSKTYFLKIINKKKIIILLPKFKLAKYHNFFFKIIRENGYKIYFMDYNETILAKSLYVVENFHHPVGLVNQSILPYLRSLVNFKQIVPKKEILWITRKKRKVINENIIIKQLKINYDVTVVDLEEISILNQIKIFNQHKIYIGPHGAGFTNIIFANPAYKRKLIEIFPEGLGTPTYCMISKSQNIKHYSYVGKNISTFQPNYSNIFINEKEFLDLVKKII
jgi:hypothetical protein